MLTPLLVELEAACHISAVAPIWISLGGLLAGAAFVPSLCRLGDDLGWKQSMAIIALGVPNGRGPAPGAPASWRQAIDLPGAAGFAIPAIALDIQAFGGFWGLAGGLSLLAAAFAAVYLVTYWSGFRGGDRAMVRRPAIEGPVPASVAD